jgi:hypothetical protein
MKKTLIKIAIFAAIGLGVYFTYEHYFGCKGTCDESCENKDSVAVSTTPTLTTTDSTKTVVADTTK